MIFTYLHISLPNKIDTILSRFLTLLLFLGFVFINIIPNKAYSNTDSLYQVFYSDTTLSVDEKLKLARTLSELYSDTDINKFIEFEAAIYHLSLIINDKKAVLNSLKKIWQSQNKICEYMVADTTLHRLLYHVKKLNEKNEIAEVTFSIASNYYDWSNYKRANEYFVRAQTYFTISENKQGIAKSMKGIAIVVSNWGDYEKAMQIV